MSNKQDIEKLREDILEVETLLAEGDTSWCIGDAYECLKSMKMRLAEMEWAEMQYREFEPEIWR